MRETPALEETLVRLFDTPGYQLLVVLVALGAGAAHALAPGHGKSIAAAYLVGAHGRVVHAAYLGLVVAAMHTVSAVVLAGLWHGLRSVLPMDFAELTAGLQVVAALIVVAAGVSLARRRHGHSHGHGHHHDHDEHGHDHHGHAHSHTDPQADPFTWGGLVALGMSGGLVPSPTVFLILVSGLVTGRVGFAVVLVLTFGLGMMLTITAVGVLTLRGMDLVRGRGGRSARLAVVGRVLPRVAALAVIVLGLTYLGLGMRTLVA